jgi:hypothetical protein
LAFGMVDPFLTLVRFLPCWQGEADLVT